ncbi:hypothetical protein IQ07DRAFT_382710 [Pyrenochaeta sp. DS3sAY3a]|nr:hypothetical protein IQ07DRAFT_382710 [Pyrenochaeta sp. DS3sAY3a]
MPDKTRYFILKDNKIVLADKPDNQITFRVLDADWGRVNESEPIMKPHIRADHSIFLVTGSNWNRGDKNPRIGSQIAGMWADKDGILRGEQDPDNKVCRWSFRASDVKIDRKTTWNPSESNVLKDGAEVKLYCHSLYAGAYRSTTQPPYFALALMTKEAPGEQNLKVLGLSFQDMRKAGKEVLTDYFDIVDPKVDLFEVYANEVGFLKKDGVNEQTAMGAFDLGRESDNDVHELDLYCKLLGAEDPTVLKELDDTIGKGTGWKDWNTN